MSSRMVGRVAWCCPVHPIVHSPGALLLPPLALLRLGVQRVGLFMVGKCMQGTARWSASESEGSPAARPVGGKELGGVRKAVGLWRNSGDTGKAEPSTHLLIYPTNGLSGPR